MNRLREPGLSVLEAGWILGKTEGQIRRLLKRATLRYMPVSRRIDPDSVAALAGDEEPRLEALDALLKGELSAPRPGRRHAKPLPIFPYLLPVQLRCATLVAHSCGSEPCGESCPRLGSTFYEVYESPWD
jgi:hypothetical protein